jgi:hypothetical protein
MKQTDSRWLLSAGKSGMGNRSTIHSISGMRDLERVPTMSTCSRIRFQLRTRRTSRKIYHQLQTVKLSKEGAHRSAARFRHAPEAR